MQKIAIRLSRDWSIAPDEFEVDLNGVRIRFHDPPVHVSGGTYRKHFLSGQYEYSLYWKNFLSGTPHEYSVIKHLAQLASRYDSTTFLDAGAHHGYFTVYMSKVIGSAGRVYSFEPNEEYFRVLSRNVEINQLRNTSLYPIALSDKTGNIVLETSRKFQSYGLMSERRKMRSSKAGEDSVPAVPFDQLNREENIQPNIVKVDVHGAEGNVIHGMKNSLTQTVEHLYCELHSEMCDGYTPKAIVETLQDVGMETLEFRGFQNDRGKFIEIHNDLFESPNARMLYARKQASERI